MIFEGNNPLSARVVNWVAEHTPRCRDITRLLSQSLDEKLPWPVRFKLHVHYSICVWCERYGKQIKLVREASLQMPDKVSQYTCEKMPVERRERIRTVLRSEAEGAS